MGLFNLLPFTSFMYSGLALKDTSRYTQPPAIRLPNNVTVGFLSS